MLSTRKEKAEHNQTLRINRLPVELFCCILEHVDRSELFEIESVCQRWAYFVKAFVGQRLVISKQTKVRPRHWFYREDYNRCNYSSPPHSVMVRSNLNVQLERSFLISLKQLKICNPTIKNKRQSELQTSNILLNNLKFLNRLTALEVLEVSQMHVSRNQWCEWKQSTIRLPNLKHLAISRVRFQNLLLDCPQLMSFRTKDVLGKYGQVDFAHPDSILHLHLDKYSTQEDFGKLKSLQYLSITDFFYHKDKEKDHANRIFSNFPNLKEISFWSSNKEDFLKLLKEKRAFAREEVELTYCGIFVDNEKHLEHIENQHDLKLYTGNYQRLCESELKWIERIDYFEHAEVLTDFHEKFKNVKEIQVQVPIDDEDRLVKFIGQFKRLESLRIQKKALLGESFFRKLADRCSSVRYLAIWLKPHDALTDFEFLFQFQHLASLTVHKRDLDDQLVRRLFDQFEAFELKYSAVNKEYDRIYDNIKITRAHKGAQFEFNVCSGHLERFDDLDELLRHIEAGCRNPFDEEHECDCECEFFFCHSDSYADNYLKRFK